MVFARAVAGLFLIWCTALQTVLAQCGENYPCINEETLDFETSDCQSYHIFVVRGSDSSYPGHLGELVRLTCKGLNDTCGYENVIYPANSSWAGPDMWCKSAATGAANGQSQIREYAEKCPDAKLMVFGFSQGGSVALDIVGGGGGPAFECEQAENGPLARSEVPGSNIVVVASFGAVRRSANQTYDIKKGKPFNGRSPRSEEQLAGLDQYKDIMRVYCNFGDDMCAVNSKPSALEKHLNYFDLYNDEASNWVIKTALGEEVEEPQGDEEEEETKSSTRSAPASTSKASKTATSTTPSATPSATPSTTQGAAAAESPSPTGSANSVTTGVWGLAFTYICIALGVLRL